MRLVRGVFLTFFSACFLSNGGGFAVEAQQRQSSPATNAALLREALNNSSLVDGKQPFHLVMKITPDAKGRNERKAPWDTCGTMEVFWVAPKRYKLILTSPNFNQVKIVSGDLVAEHDEGDFYPRWLDNFVKALLEPVPQMDRLIESTNKLSGGGTFQFAGPGGSGSISMPRCVNVDGVKGKDDVAASMAGFCVDAREPWFQGGRDYTRYISMSDYQRFGQQMVPRKWRDDIPENVMVLGTITKLEKLSPADAEGIHVQSSTALKDQIRTVFLPQWKIEGLVEPPPQQYEWPAENTEVLEGFMIIYVRTDRTGQIRESYWDSSDNYKLQNAGVQLALRMKLTPLLVDGAAVQIEGPLVLHFKTHRDPSAKPLM